MCGFLKGRKINWKKGAYRHLCFIALWNEARPNVPHLLGKFDTSRFYDAKALACYIVTRPFAWLFRIARHCIGGPRKFERGQLRLVPQSPRQLEESVACFGSVACVTLRYSLKRIVDCQADKGHTNRKGPSQELRTW